MLDTEFVQEFTRHVFVARENHYFIASFLPSLYRPLEKQHIGWMDDVDKNFQN